MGRNRYAIAIALAVCCAPFGLGNAHADEATLTRLREIHATVMDPTKVFSISQTLGELDKLAGKVDATPPNSPARGELNYLRGFIHYRAKRPEQSIPPSLEAIRIDEAAPFLVAKERVKFIYNVATQAEDMERWPLAIAHYRKTLALAPTDPGMTEDQRLGTMERLAYCLHEAGEYGEAKATNETLLVAGERLYGADALQLRTVLNNLAQNHHALKNLPAARTALERRLTIATKHNAGEIVEDTLFQLGVLAFEMDQPKEAETLLRRRLAVAEASKDKARIAAAKADLDHLFVKLKDQSRKP